MDILLICRDALANSLVSNLLLAMKYKERGQEAGVLFVSEALAALCRGTFLWPRELREAEVRLQIADNAKAAGLPVFGRGELRQLDVWQILAKAQQAGLPMFASPSWVGLLGLKGKLPPGVKEIDEATAFKLFEEAKTIIGSL